MMDIFFPENITCIFCNIPISRGNDLSLCKSCYKKMKYIDEICIRCGRFGEGTTFCTNCSGENYHFDRAYSVLEYSDLMHSNIYKYKYGHKGFLAKYFAEILKRFIEVNDLSFDYITGVPITQKRQAQRGYNQSYLMAERIDEDKFIELFVRKKETKFMSKLSKVRRMIELEDAFGLVESKVDKIVGEKYFDYHRKSEILDESRILENSNREKMNPNEKIKLMIIDDILTTGSTVNEMSKLAKNNIADIDITVLTLCSARK